MRNRGYIYTLLTILMVMLLLSLIFFYFQITKPRISDTVTNLRTDEMYYLVGAIVDDYQRSTRISAQRAAVYSINEVINKKHGLASYNFTPCATYSGARPPDGAEAAIAELILCGRINNTFSPVMENHTMDVWLNRSRNLAAGMGFDMRLNITDFRVLPFGAFNILVLANTSVEVSDRTGNPLKSGSVLADAVVPIAGLYDPLYYPLYTDSPLVLRFFRACNRTPMEVTPEVFREWLDGECYVASSLPLAPSFFDRLDGRLAASEVYLSQAEGVALMVGEPSLNSTGLESLINLDAWVLGGFEGAEGFKNQSWVDYMQWSGARGDCNVSGVSGEAGYAGFALDSAHALAYYASNLTCVVSVTHDAVSDVLVDSSLSVPPGASVRWVNRDSDENHTLWVEGDDGNWCFHSGVVLDFEGDSHECDFAGKSYGESLLYSSEGLTHSQASGLVLVSEPASARGYALVCGVRYYCGINTDGVCPRDFGVECSFEDDDDCAGSSFSLRSYFGGGSLPKHEFFGQFNLSGPPQTPVPAGTPVFVNSSTGDYWITRVGDGGLYSVNVSFDNLSTGFDEGTVEGAGLSFSVSGASVPELQVASSGARTELNFVLPAGSCVPGASCSSSGCVGSWFKLNRSGVGHDACLYPNYLGCVRNSSVGFFDQACCLGIVSQMIYY